MTIAEAMKLKDAAQATLEQAIKSDYPVGTKVVAGWIRGKAEFTVSGYDGEILLLHREGAKDIRRRFDSVEKA